MSTEEKTEIAAAQPTTEAQITEPLAPEPTIDTTLAQLDALVKADADPLTAAISAVVRAWNLAHGIPGGPAALFGLFGCDLTADKHLKSHWVSTTLHGHARPVDGEALEKLPQIIAKAKAEGEEGTR